MTKKILMHKFLKRTFTLAMIGVSALLISFQASAQDDGINYSVQLDTNMIAIGDQINLNLSVEQPKGLMVAFPVFSDSIVNGVEILKQFPQDTVKMNDGLIKVNKNYTITSFDGGVYKLKPFEFKIHDQNTWKAVRTDTLLLGVQTPKIDTTKANFDIVMPIHTPVSFAELAPWGLGGLLFIALVVFLIWYFKYRKADEPLFAAAKKLKEPAHVIALRKLDEVKKEKLWQTGKVKEFYSELTDTIRIYLDERYQLSTVESTTDEILTAVKSVEVNNNWHSNLREILERADLAKFAKFKPLPDENERSLKYAYEIVENTILVEKEEKESEENKEETEVKN
jgi:hypothetical protein